MYTTIIVPIDDSPLATKALPYAISLAQTFGASLTLVQVVEPDSQADRRPNAENIVREAADTHVSRLREAICNPTYALHLQPDAVKCVIAYGERNPTLIRSITEENADLVVMTTHGRAGIPLLALGSVASHIVRHAGVPVLLIRPATNSVSEPIENLLSTHVAVSRERPILVPLDGTEEAETIFEPAIALANAIGAPIALLRVIAPFTPLTTIATASVPMPDPYNITEQRRLADSYLRQVRSQIVAQGVTCSYKVEMGNVTEQIVAYTNEIAAQYIVMMTRQHNLFARFVLGSTAEGVIRHVTVPVFALHPTETMAGFTELTETVGNHV